MNAEEEEEEEEEEVEEVEAEEYPLLLDELAKSVALVNQASLMVRIQMIARVVVLLCRCHQRLRECCRLR